MDALLTHRLSRRIAPAAVAGLFVGVALQFIGLEQRVASGEVVPSGGYAQLVFIGLFLSWVFAAIWRLRRGKGRVLTSGLALVCLGLYVGLPLVLAVLGTKPLNLGALEYVARAVISVSALTALASVWATPRRTARGAVSAAEG